LIKRLSRVFSNHWIVSLTFAGFTFILPLLNGENLFSYIYKAILNLSLFQAFFPDRSVNFAFNGVTWTLSVDLFFYVFFIYLRRLNTRNLFFLFLSLFSIKFFLETVWALLNIKFLANWLFYIFPVFRLPEFLLGMLICRIHFNNTRAFSWFKIKPLKMFLSLILIIGICRYCLSPYNIYLYSFIPTILSFLLFLSCLALPNDQSNFFDKKLLLFLGEASFSIYLIHQPIFNLARKLFEKFKLTMSVGIMLLLMIFMLILAIGYFIFIERKVYKKSIKILHRLFDNLIFQKFYK
jgi:peptidoglycan/LPS O-acetylase OafA/YrhL